MLRFLRQTLHPARYHGRLRGQRPPFFEGWYYKLIDPTERHRLAVIPGIFWSGHPHAFVQVLDGAAGVAHYHDYPVESFWAAEDRFEVHVAGSRFTVNELSLLIDRPGQSITGALRFGGLAPWPVTLTAPGIMGWYAWVPFMECYHGVVSLDHAIYGSLTIDGRQIDFSGGRGYIEKDWGHSFPEAYIWFQSNHFARPGTSLTASIAIIPWLWTASPASSLACGTAANSTASPPTPAPASNACASPSIPSIGSSATAAIAWSCSLPRGRTPASACSRGRTRSRWASAWPRPCRPRCVCA
jgi:hypothetical protein